MGQARNLLQTLPKYPTLVSSWTGPAGVKARARSSPLPASRTVCELNSSLLSRPVAAAPAHSPRTHPGAQRSPPPPLPSLIQPWMKPSSDHTVPSSELCKDSPAWHHDPRPQPCCPHGLPGLTPAQFGCQRCLRQTLHTSPGPGCLVTTSSSWLRGQGESLCGSLLYPGPGL